MDDSSFVLPTPETTNAQLLSVMREHAQRARLHSVNDTSGTPFSTLPGALQPERPPGRREHSTRTASDTHNEINAVLSLLSSAVYLSLIHI